MKVERDTATTTYRNNHCALNVPKSRDFAPRLITFIGEFDFAFVDISRRDASRVLKKMKKIS